MELHGLGHAHAFGRGRMEAKAAWMSQVASGEQTSKGQRIVGKLDQDGDGKLGMSELKDTKFGARLSVDRFAKLDSNQDGALSASEIDAGRKGHHSHESAVRMQMQGGPAGQIVAALDQSQSGGVGAQDVSGTRLGDLIGTGFGTIDANQNGTLDAKELAAFLVDALTAATETPATTATDGTTGAGGTTTSAGTTATPAPSTAASGPADTDDAAGTVETDSEGSATDQIKDAAPSSTSRAASGTDPLSAITSSFEAALSVLQNGGTQPTAYDAVASLYADVKNIIAA